jgi:hypothetical protein
LLKKKPCRNPDAQASGRAITCSDSDPDTCGIAGEAQRVNLSRE